MAAFALFAFMMAVASLFALAAAPYAAVVQVVLYVGGAMVLILFALFLYPDAGAPPRWTLFRENFGKAALLLVFGGMALFFLPWAAFNEWAAEVQKKAPPASSQAMGEAGKTLLTIFPFEFEMLGVLLLAGMIAAGWYVKSSENSQP